MEKQQIKAGDTFIIPFLPKTAEKGIFEINVPYVADKVDLILNEVWVGEKWVGLQFVKKISNG